MLIVDERFMSPTECRTVGDISTTSDCM